jgi:hypothetical protein
MSQTDDELDDSPEKITKDLKLRLDPVHYEALIRVAKFEHLKRADTVRRLIRIADQIISGSDSPFAENLESLFQRKAG